MLAAALSTASGATSPEIKLPENMICFTLLRESLKYRAESAELRTISSALNEVAGGVFPGTIIL